MKYWDKVTLAVVSGVLSVAVVATIYAGTSSEALATYSNGQSVRVYSPEGRHLFTGEVCGSELPYVTLCRIVPKGIGGKFKNDQQALIDTRTGVLLVTTHIEGFMSQRRTR